MAAYPGQVLPHAGAREYEVNSGSQVALVDILHDGSTQIKKNAYIELLGLYESWIRGVPDGVRIYWHRSTVKMVLAGGLRGRAFMPCQFNKDRV
jgi:hypothetical protein